MLGGGPVVGAAPARPSRCRTTTRAPNPSRPPTAPYSFPSLPPHTFHGLPGLLADALPDKYGQALIDAWLGAQGRAPGSFNAVERLCYVGTRGMGALEFRPATGPRARRAKRLEVEALVQLASDVLAARTAVRGRLDSLQDILLVGTSPMARA